jgi:hypothetical protein
MGRLADMWLRPRVENLPIDLDWWVYAHHNAETRFSWAYAALNAVYLLLGLAGLCLRYTLECFPMLFACGGITVYAASRKVGAWFRMRLPG